MNYDDDDIVKDDGPKSTPHPAGQFAARCVDAIQLGEKVKTFAGKSEIVKVCAIVFRTGQLRDDGKFLDLFERFTVSMFRLANFRKFLEQWRGNPFTEAEAEAGVSLKKLIGRPGLITVAHKNRFANIVGIVPLHPAIPPVPPSDYVRGDWVAGTREKLARAVAAFRAQAGRPDDGRTTPPAMPPEPWDYPDDGPPDDGTPWFDQEGRPF